MKPDNENKPNLQETSTTPNNSSKPEQKPKPKPKKPLPGDTVLQEGIDPSRIIKKDNEGKKQNQNQ